MSSLIQYKKRQEKLAKENGTTTTVVSDSKNNDPPGKNEKQRIADLEAKAVAEATASADESYVPSPSLLNASSADPLLKQVDGPSLSLYEGKASSYCGKSIPISPRGKLDLPINVTAPGSVVEYNITTSGYDIVFGITAEREEGVTVVKESGKVDAHVAPITGKFLVGAVPCMLVFVFNNEYSMFREKKLSYKITITPPSSDIIKNGRRRRAKACLKTVQQDLTTGEESLEKTTKTKENVSNQIKSLEKQLSELQNQLKQLSTDEDTLSKRVNVRKEQISLLQKRLTDGWDDEN